jgi:hypothetical protein
MSGIFISTVDDLVKALEGKLDQDVCVDVAGTEYHCPFCGRSNSLHMKKHTAAQILKVYSKGGHVVIEVEPK